MNQYRAGSHQYCADSHDDLTGHSYIIVGGNPMTATLYTKDLQTIKGPPADNAPEALRKFAEVLQVYADKIKTHVPLAERWVQRRHERSVVGRP